jgi:hypothetical protein
MRNGYLFKEVEASHFERYTSTFWNEQKQPYQDVDFQFKSYIKQQYNAQYFKNMNHHSPHFGVWITCFVAFLNNDESVNNFLNLWYLQTLKYTTQDQIGFPYVCKTTKLIPLTLPNNEIYGNCPHDRTMFYIKHNNGL